MNETLVTKYRSQHDLQARPYIDEQIRSCVMIINRRLRIAVFQGWDDLAFGLAELLHKAEPLEERRIDDQWGVKLQKFADLIEGKPVDDE